MNIAYIFPPFSHKKFEEDIDVVSREFSTPPPLGLAYAAAISEKAGHKSLIIDANCVTLEKTDVLEQLIEFKAEVLCFLLTAYMFRQTLEWIKFLKKELDLPVIVGNVLLDIYPEEVMTHKEIDYAVIGPAVKPFPLLLDAITHKDGFGKIEGIAYKEKGRLFINPPATLQEDFDILPFPARHLLDNSKYHTIISKRKNFTIMMTSKGCPSRCGFCYVKNIPYSSRRAEAVVDEIQECYDRYSIREIEFFDPVFTFERQRVLDICWEICRRKIDIRWACRARVDQIDEEMLAIMKKAGCARIYYGIECGNQTTLNNMNKGISIEKVKKIIELTKKQGILTLGFFLIGAPGDTVESIKDTIKLALSLKLDYAQFHKTIAKPAGKLYEMVKESTGRDYWSEFISGKASEERLPSPWTEVTEEEIEKLTVKAYRRFYFNPGRLLKLALSVRSFHEFKRYARSAIGLLAVKSDIDQNN